MLSRTSTIVGHPGDVAVATFSELKELREDQHNTEEKPGIHQEVPTVAQEVFPEGGTAAWCTVVGAALVQSCGFGYVSSYGVYQDFYTQHYLTNETPSAISWIGSVNAFLVTAIAPVAGLLYDRGYFYPLVIGGSLLQCFSLFMLSLTQQGQYYQIFLAQGLGSGIAQGLMYIPSMAVVSHYFHRRRTLAMTFVASGSPVGSIVHPIMLNNLIKRVGFANGVRINAALVSVLLLTSCLLMRTRLGLPKNPTNYWRVTKGVVRDTPFLVMTMGILFAGCGFYYPLFYFQLASTKHGNSLNFSFYSLAILNSCNFIGRFSSGFISVHTGVPMLMIFATFACGILILGMIKLGSLTSVVILGIIYGYFSGMYIALMAPLMAVLTSDTSQLGGRMGVSFFVAGIGGLVGSPIAGALLTSNYVWWIPSLFAGLAMLAGDGLLVIMQLLLARHNRVSGKGGAELIG